MEWEFIAPMVAMMTLILTAGAVLVLRPVAKRLGDLIELMIEERRGRASGDAVQLRDLVETLNARLAVLEERQDFQESLLSGPRPRKEMVEGPPSA